MLDRGTQHRPAAVAWTTDPLRGRPCSCPPLSSRADLAHTCAGVDSRRMALHAVSALCGSTAGFPASWCWESSGPCSASAAPTSTAMSTRGSACPRRRADSDVGCEGQPATDETNITIDRGSSRVRHMATEMADVRTRTGRSEFLLHRIWMILNNVGWRRQGRGRGRAGTSLMRTLERKPSPFRRARPSDAGEAEPTSLAARPCLSSRRAPPRLPWHGSCRGRGGRAHRRRRAAGSRHRC